MSKAVIGRRGFAAVLGASAFPLGARADDFPQKPVTLVVPFAPGGSIDILARLAARHAGTALGPVRPRARGVIRHGASRRAPEGCHRGASRGSAGPSRHPCPSRSSAQWQWRRARSVCVRSSAQRW